MEAIEDIAEEIIEEALLQGAEIDHIVTDDDRFSRHGMGALLRFTI